MKKFYASGKCPKCGGQLLLSDIQEYSFACEDCCEYFLTNEVKENMADYYEISIKMGANNFKKNLDKFNEVAEKYNIPAINIRVISNNELLGESYDRTTGANSQEFALKLIREVINQIRG